MQISSQSNDNGVTIFNLEGRVDSNGAGQMDDALQSALTDGHFKIVLEMSRVSYINSAGLRTLADVLTQCRNQGGSLKLVALSTKVERVFKIIGFDKFFDIYESIESASADF